jgi:ABC-type branched-subunit amino acid transport system ATPase component
MIEARRLSKRYGRIQAVEDLSFTVCAGQVTGFLGPNGSGKSTTMRMILGLDSPTSGSVTIGGQRYGEMRFPLHRVGALLDAGALHPGRTARNHLVWLADSNAISRQRVDIVLDAVGLSDVAHRRAGQFSLGMSQRLGIAAALLGDPEVLIFDEPINGLDPEGILWVPASRHAGVSIADPGVCRAVLGGAFHLVLVGAIAVTLGALVRRTAGAIAILFAVLLVIPGLVTLLPSPWNNDVTKYLPNSAGVAMSAIVRVPDLLSPLGGLIVLCGYTAIALMTAMTVLSRRDA